MTPVAVDIEFVWKTPRRKDGVSISNRKCGQSNVIQAAYAALEAAISVGIWHLRRTERAALCLHRRPLDDDVHPVGNGPGNMSVINLKQ